MCYRRWTSILDLVVWLRGWLICIYIICIVCGSLFFFVYAFAFLLWGGKVKFVMGKQVLPRIYLLNCLATEIKCVLLSSSPLIGAFVGNILMRLGVPHKQKRIEIDSIMIDFKCIYNFLANGSWHVDGLNNIKWFRCNRKRCMQFILCTY